MANNGINKVFLIGNLGKDPEIRVFNENKKASFSIATGRSWKDASGNKVEKTDWHNVSVWGKLAEIVEKYVKKGMKLYIEGALNYSSYEDNMGNKKYFTEIVASQLSILTPKGDTSQLEEVHQEMSQEAPIGAHVIER